MPFDGGDFEPYRNKPKPPAPRDTGLCIAIFVVAVGLLVLPLSLDGLIDLIRYVSRR